MAIKIEYQTVICKYCQTEPPEGAKFCPNCGKRIPQPKPAAPDFSDLIIRQVDPVLKHAEACKFLKCSPWMLYELGNQRKIPFFQVGNRRRYYTQDLVEWMRCLDGPITTI